MSFQVQHVFFDKNYFKMEDALSWLETCPEFRNDIIKPHPKFHVFQQMKVDRMKMKLKGLRRQVTRNSTKGVWFVIWLK